MRSTQNNFPPWCLDTLRYFIRLHISILKAPKHEQSTEYDVILPNILKSGGIECPGSKQLYLIYKFSRWTYSSFCNTSCKCTNSTWCLSSVRQTGISAAPEWGCSLLHKLSKWIVSFYCKCSYLNRFKYFKISPPFIF
jgi:hypothetical protein